MVEMWTLLLEDAGVATGIINCLKRGFNRWAEDKSVICGYQPW